MPKTKGSKNKKQKVQKVKEPEKQPEDEPVVI